MNQFVDRVEIFVQAGNGGDGCAGFRREKYVPQGGPDGGDGGKGADIVFIADENLTTLLDFRYRSNLKAQDGARGQGALKTGAQGEKLIVRVPVGTMVINQDTRALLYDFKKHQEQCIIAHGGRGGRGNSHFKSSVNQTPFQKEDGAPGEELRLILELKLIADGGIIGLPNAGKSSLIRKLSRSKSKVAAYQFTTLSPVLGVMKFEYKQIVLADLPGLVEGAHQNVGLGIQFLKHVERTHFLMFVVDFEAVDGVLPWDAFEIVLKEMKLHNSKLLKKERIIVGNKVDLPMAIENIDEFKARYPKERLFMVSAATGQGITELVLALKHMQDRDENNSYE